MPMQLTVSRQRKTSENYNSQGHGISLTVELDQTLLARPRELQDVIAEIYREADQALVRQDGAPEPQAQVANGNGQRTPRTRSGSMTASQRKAIEAIANTLGICPIEEARHELGLNLDELTVRQASRLIDHLKSLQPSRNHSRN